VEEEEEKNEFLYIVTALSAVLNMLFAVEVNEYFIKIAQWEKYNIPKKLKKMENVNISQKEAKL